MKVVVAGQCWTATLSGLYTQTRRRQSTRLTGLRLLSEGDDPAGGAAPPVPLRRHRLDLRSRGGPHVGHGFVAHADTRVAFRRSIPADRAGAFSPDPERLAAA